MFSCHLAPTHQHTQRAHNATHLRVAGSQAVNDAVGVTVHKERAVHHLREAREIGGCAAISLVLVVHVAAGVSKNHDDTVI